MMPTLIPYDHNVKLWPNHALVMVEYPEV